MYTQAGKCLVVLGVLFAAAFGSAAEETQTYAERLGWGAEDRVLMIHSDDIGMSHATNQATIESLEKGIVTSISVMMPTPWVSEWRAYMEENPDVCMGLHLTHTNEWDPYRWGPVAGRDEVPGLVDPHGYMWPSVGDVVENATPDEVETEIRAQIELARRMDLPISHLDSHMGTLYDPKFIERFVEVGIDEQIPVMFPSPEAAVARGLDWAEAAQLLADRLWEAGLPIIDEIHTDSYNWKTTDKVDEFVDAIRNLEPGVTVMIVHPTKPNPVIDVITDGREHLYGDYYALISDEVKQAIEDEDIILTTWKELHERRQALDE